MTREEAITTLKEMHDSFDEIHENTNYEIGYEQMTATEMAIEALTDRPQGEWIFNPTDAIDLMFAKPKCSKCGFESSDGGNFCPNCGADMREDSPHGFTADEWYRDTFKGEEE